MYFKAISICCLWGLPVIIYFFYLNICGKTLAAGNILRKWKNLKLIYAKSDVFGGWWNSYSSKDLTDIGYERWNGFSTVMEQKTSEGQVAYVSVNFCRKNFACCQQQNQCPFFTFHVLINCFQFWTDTVKGKLQQ